MRSHRVILRSSVHAEIAANILHGPCKPLMPWHPDEPRCLFRDAAAVKNRLTGAEPRVRDTTELEPGDRRNHADTDISSLVMAKGQERGFAHQVSLVAQHGVPEVVDVAQPVANPPELRRLVPLARNRRCAHQAVGSDALALDERKICAPQTALRQRAKALSVLQHWDQVRLLGKQLATLFALLKPSAQPDQRRPLERLDDLEHIPRVVWIREQLANGSDGGDGAHGFHLHGSTDARTASHGRAALGRAPAGQPQAGAACAHGLPYPAVALDATSSERDVLSEARSLRQQVLDSSLLVAVAVGGVAFVRTLLDAIDIEAWRIARGAIALYGGFVILFFAKRLPYRIRALCFLGLLYVVGVYSLLMAGYLAAPVLILACQSVLASVLFRRRVTLAVLGLNLLTLLAVGAVLSSGLMVVETTTFYDPAGFTNWIRVAAIFAVFCGIAVVSVDVVTNHLNQSLRDQAELIERLKGAMQLRDEAESQRRAAESRLRDTHHGDDN